MRKVTVLASALMALAVSVAVATPALADGWENRITVESGGKTQTYTGMNALPNAIAGLPQGASTVTLQGDCEYKTWSGATWTIPAGRNVTLVLNGFDLDAEGCALTVAGSLTIANGTAYGTGDVDFDPQGTAPGMVVTGTLTLTSGEITSDGGPAVQTSGAGVFTMNGGQVDSSVYNGGVIVAAGGRVTINGGTVENGANGGAVLAANGGTIQVNAGTFEPSPVPATMLGTGVIQVAAGSRGDIEYTVGTNGAILTYLNGPDYPRQVTVVNGTLNITSAIPAGVMVTAQAPGVLQVNGQGVSSYTGTGQTPGQTPSPGPNPDNPPIAGDLEPVWRLYNQWTHGHYYVEADDVYEDELRDLIRRGWTNEGVKWYAPDEGRDVYQLYNPYNHDHYWTMDRSEYYRLQRNGWRPNGDAWESAPASTGKPIYQLFNPYVTVNTHLWTADINEVNTLVKNGWQSNGIAWYAAALPRP